MELLTKIFKLVFMAIVFLSVPGMCHDYDSSEEFLNETCPALCKCDTYGTLGTKVTCYNFTSSYIFSPGVAQIEIFNISDFINFVLEEDVFKKVNLKNVNSITINHSGLTNVSKNAFRDLSMLYSVSLSQNQLISIHPDTFSTNTELRFLSLSQNPLVIANESTYFLNVPSLKQLDISKCLLSFIPDSTFTKLKSLEELNMANNNISTIDSYTFASLEILQVLDVSNNKIEKIPSNAFVNNPELTYLYMNDNPMTTLKDVKIPDLLILELKNCNMTKIDQDTFTGLASVVNLNLSGNRITSIHEMAFQKMEELLYIDLSYNNLKGPLNPNTFINNIKLETLSLSNNPNMKNMPSSGFQGRFSEFYKLDLQNCGLQRLDRNSFKGLSFLTTLNLSENALEDIRPGVIPSNIYILDLSRNVISDLNRVNLPMDINIRKLILKNNPLKKLNPILLSNVQHMTSLDVSFCNIEKLWGDQIPEQVLPRLETLNLAENNLQALTPGELEMIGNLRELDITKNPFKCDKSFHTLIEWLKGQEIFANSLPSDVMISDKEDKNAELLLTDIDELPEDDLGWSKFVKKTCVSKSSDKLNNSNKITNTKFKEVSTSNSLISPYLDKNSSKQLHNEETVVREVLKMNEKSSLLTILAIAVGALVFVIVGSVAVLKFIQCATQRPVYGQKNVIKRAISTPKLKRDVSSYSPLTEDPNTPTTPMINQRSGKIGDQVYNIDSAKRETQRNIPDEPVTYISSKFHHSNIIPETV